METDRHVAVQSWNARSPWWESFWLFLTGANSIIITHSLFHGRMSFASKQIYTSAPQLCVLRPNQLGGHFGSSEPYQCNKDVFPLTEGVVFAFLISISLQACWITIQAVCSDALESNVSDILCSLIKIFHTKPASCRCIFYFKPRQVKFICISKYQSWGTFAKAGKTTP